MILKRLSVLSSAGMLLLTAVSAAEQTEPATEAAWLHEASVGIFHHDTDNLWSGFRRESGADVNAELLFARFATVLGGGLHPALGALVSLSGDTSKAYAGVRWRYEFESRVFAGVGLGAAIHDGETETAARDRKELGSRVLFHIPFEIGYRFDERMSAAVYFDHVSNADLAEPNEGMDTLGIRLGYRF